MQLLRDVNQAEWSCRSSALTHLPPPNSLSDLSDTQRHELGAKAKEESIESQPYISTPLGLEDLAREYQNGDISFQRKVRWLKGPGNFKAYFKARGDGDCF